MVREPDAVEERQTLALHQLRLRSSTTDCVPEYVAEPKRVDHRRRVLYLAAELHGGSLAVDLHIVCRHEGDEPLVSSAPRMGARLWILDAYFGRFQERSQPR